MIAIGMPRLARRGSMVVSVTLLALAGLAGAPGVARAQFPGWIPMANTPSGVAVDKPGNVYVSVREGDRGVIWKYTPDGTPSFFKDIGQATIYGLAVTANGDVYAAMAAPGPERGIYRVDRKGNAERLPGTERMILPNGLAFDDRGTLYVTESFSMSAAGYGEGGIWRIPPRGAAELWVRDPLLTGIGLGGNPPMGANGIAYYHGDLFVTNTDKKLVLRIPVEKDGSAGELDLWTQIEEVPESPLAGFPIPIMPDGLALDVHGNLYLTILTRNAVVRLMADTREQQTIAVLGSPGPVPSAPLDFPASLAFGTGAGEQQNLFVTNLGWMVRFFPTGKWPGAALVKVDAGAPGRPLK
ncbi:MAG: SMP-30/gluconolactonase/LRE family protein [Desulfobacterales bacterium]|jgi:sugar lactone lactonase YvrE|nr:SMP-30/gluconolactonase/LRE family protein [Desulfobacterales bacterium]